MAKTPTTETHNSRTQQVVLMLLVAFSALTLGYTSKQTVFPVLAYLIALVGLTGRFQWGKRPLQRAIAQLLVGLLFAIYYRFFNPISELSAAVGVAQARWTAFAQYFLALMVLNLFFPAGRLRPVAIGLAGMLSVLSAGQILHNAATDLRYVLMSMAYVLAMILSGPVCNREQASTGQFWSRGRIALSAGILIVVAGAGIVGGRQVYQHHKSLDTYLVNLGPLQRMLFKHRPPGGNTTGYSETGRLSRTGVRKTENHMGVALRVYSEQCPGYLRGRAFELYANAEWLPVSDYDDLEPNEVATIDASLPGEGNLFTLHDHDGPTRPPLDIWPAVRLTEGMFAPRHAVAVRAPVDLLQANPHGVIDADELLSGLNYIIAATDIDPAPAPTPELLDYCLRIPARLNPEIAALADELFADCTTTQEKISKVIKHFDDNYTYSLSVDIPRRQDPLDYFLLHSDHGYCEYFASGAALLLRLADVPTRYVTGFVVAEKDNLTGAWVGRNRDAHAWTEAWDEQKDQWVLVEATTGADAAIELSPAGWDRRLREFIAFRLQELRVALHHQGIRGFFAFVGRMIGDLFAAIAASWWGRAIIMGLLVIMLAHLRRGYARHHQNKLDRWIDLHRLRDRADQLAEKRWKLIRHDHETLNQFVERMQPVVVDDAQGQALQQWYQQYAQIRYDRPADTDAIKELRLRWTDISKSPRNRSA